ncbi:MAG: glycosyltransferase family 4 protein [Solirubrobacterales bacterium]|nr:glycosyltransferase family 4 protein [Solirubrobacterales bacterium]
MAPAAHRSDVPLIALVHDNFAGPTGMGAVVNSFSHFVLDAGWRLAIIGDNVPDDLRAGAEQVIEVRNPSGLSKLPEHLEWSRRARRALRAVRADLIHVHAPTLADVADLHTSHMIARAAHERGGEPPARGAEARLRAVQARATLLLDDRLHRRIVRRTHLSFVSELLRDEFRRLYGEPRGGWVVSPSAPPWQPPTDARRREARARFVVDADRLTVGFLGGVDERKGFREALALAGEPELDLLFAGPGSEQVTAGDRPGLGFVEPEGLLAACDVLVAPTTFDPAPVAVLEGLSRGVPVVTTRASGWAGVIERTGAGAIWSAGSSLADACRRAARVDPRACRRFVEEAGSARQSERLLTIYRELLGRPDGAASARAQATIRS